MSAETEHNPSPMPSDAPDTAPAAPEQTSPVLDVIEREITEVASDPEATPQSMAQMTLSDQIKADPELMEVLERRPDLCNEFMRRAEVIDVLAQQMKGYLTASVEGFEQMHEGLLLLEVPDDPGTGQPARTAEGGYLFPRLDELQRTVLDRFMSYQRIWYVWPQLVQRISSLPNLTDDERKLRLSAINLVRAMLCEYGPIPSGTC